MNDKSEKIMTSPITLVVLGVFTAILSFITLQATPEELSTANSNAVIDRLWFYLSIIAFCCVLAINAIYRFALNR